jgi:hypothetical protein
LDWGGGIMGYIWARNIKEALGVLEDFLAEPTLLEDFVEELEVNMNVEARIKELIDKLKEFDKKHNSTYWEDIVAGYIIRSNWANIYIDALIITGDSKPKVIIVNIEDWNP